MTDLLRIADIQIGARHRKDLGDLRDLIESIRRVGLLHPVVVTPEGHLIAGERRIEAFRALGREHIPAHIVRDLDEARAWLVAERDENTVRKDFTPEEAVRIGLALEEIEKPAAQARQWAGTPSGKLPEGPNGKGEALIRVAGAIGMSRHTYERARAVVEAAESDPQTFGPLVADMNRSGNVTRAWRKMQAIQDERAIQNGRLSIVKGRYRTIVVDPPWEYDTNLLGRSRPEYAVMGLAALEDLPVGEWADDDCHLYLWATNAMLPKACGLLAAWGFDYKTLITWVKPRIGLGAYFRNSTEHVLFAVRGERATRVKDIPTHFEAPANGHSVKPAALYDIVQRASWPPYLEVFARQPRDGWAAWGNLDG